MDDLIAAWILGLFVFFVGSALTHTDTVRSKLVFTAPLAVTIPSAFAILAFHRVQGSRVSEITETHVSNILLVLYIFSRMYWRLVGLEIPAKTYNTLILAGLVLGNLHCWIATKPTGFPPWPVYCLLLTYTVASTFFGNTVYLTNTMHVLGTCILVFNALGSVTGLLMLAIWTSALYATRNKV
jgi:hypothetical protein